MWNYKNNPSPKPFPLWQKMRRYRLPQVQADLRAAFTVALLALPQSMTYALIAGLPPSVGLFAAIFGTIFTSTFGSSSHLITGCTNTVAILIQSAIAEVLYSHYRDIGPDARAAPAPIC
jgi:SulP family sulfate permease